MCFKWTHAMNVELLNGVYYTNRLIYTMKYRKENMLVAVNGIKIIRSW